MRGISLSSISLAILLLCPGQLPAADEAALKAEANAVIKTYVTRLKGALRGALAEGGPVRAIETCRLQAPAFAEEISRSTGWQVGRTSLRVRNPDNRPDAWEKAALEEFERQHRRGVPAAKLVRATIVEDEQGRRFRFLKAIPTGKLCLVCHGEKIAPAVRQALRKNYPGDRATGFSQGDLRGAFTLSKPLD
ncbi:uncharacterized protein DUF3365 [Geothermobacter ehrlichii]|uniref:Uncharacterized protein DUF3365 n=1 Tax=Geothermobacter ehrlichii TaxID=213224 RepID=A0A5D3WNY4_9BACT|nr:DUF3365 domain-containing protein [Geothermobacter ehrlichii]TYO99359.1 uncharacterized protein DUF3365 [Geothermobacter ehrlichii]